MKRRKKNLFVIVAGPLLVFLIAALAFQLYFLDKYYPGIFVASVNLGSVNTFKAKSKVEDTISKRLSNPLTFYHQDEEFTLNISSASVEKFLDKSLDEAFRFGRSRFYFSLVNIPVVVELGNNFDKEVEKLSFLDEPAVDSKIIFEEDTIKVTPSQNGKVLDKKALKTIIGNYINTGKLSQNSLPFKTSYPKLQYESALEIKKSLDYLKQNPLVLQFEDIKQTVTLTDVLEMIDLENSQPSLVSGKILDSDFNIAAFNLGENQYSDIKLTINPKLFGKFIARVESSINRPVQEPLFNFENGKVVEFRPPIEGRKLETEKARFLLEEALMNNTSEVNLPVTIIPTKNKLTNDLGIKELLGKGISNFSGSIPNRIFNISLAASRLNGVLVAPGETFSFNNTVGDISSESGYKQAYVIKSGRTVLDDGGGVCQVSTTLFRAVLNSGLPVIARTAHAYRVGYYEQGFPPGLDATIFSPSVDFKFKNDTPSHILIQSRVLGTSLQIEFYGTSDGRIAQISTSQITNQTPPPPELRQDDPTLPRGIVKQVDWAAWGANVVFTRTVTRGEETLIKETYKSNYRPWQAVYLVGTGV